MDDRIINGRTVVTTGRAARALGRADRTVVRYWEEGVIEGYRGQNGWLYLYWDSVLKFIADEVKNDGP
jgi:hypothetical protein